ncbi:glycogen branching protein [Burkholderia pseudomallei]|nr:glycogen branching protein [Burkholderia pseudomallei]
MTSGPGDAPRTAGPLVTRIVSRGGDMPALSRRKPTNARAHRAGRLRQARFSRVCFVRNAQSHRVARAVFSFLSHRPSAFGTERSSSVVCRSSFVVPNTALCVVRRASRVARLASRVSRLASRVSRLASRVSRLASRVSRLAFNSLPPAIRHSTSDVHRTARRVRHSTFDVQRATAARAKPHTQEKRPAISASRFSCSPHPDRSRTRFADSAASPRQAGWAAVPPSDDGRRAASCCA